jgi:ATP-dependent exoDNAse (exonuclease V) beta subunit
LERSYGVVPPAIADAIGIDDRESAEERERLLYVACTRAMEMLIIPQFSVRRPDNTWTEVLRLAQDEIEEWDGSQFARRRAPPAPEEANHQTLEVFLDEQQRVAKASKSVRWVRPSDEDPDRRLIEVIRTAGDASDADAPVRKPVAGSSTRGAILHKLIEEVLTGEIAETEPELASRAAALVGQLGPLRKARARLRPRWPQPYCEP